MSNQAQTGDVVENFKTVYGKEKYLIKGKNMLEKKLPFAEKQKVGDTYKELVVLGDEVGFTYGGSGTDLITVNPAIAGQAKQTSVSPYVGVLPSILPAQVASRAAGAGDKAFFEATKHVVKSNIESHGRFLETSRWYGQSTNKIGAVSYATASYRGVAFTNGTGTLSSEYFGSVAFTNGVNSGGYILLAPGEFAAGIWTGRKNVPLKQITASTGVVAAQGKLVSVDPDLGILKVDFAPTAASAANSHHLAFDGMENTGEQMGVHAIMSTTSTLFGINTADYDLWQTSKYNANGLLTEAKVYQAIARCVNRSGFEGEHLLVLNPRSWHSVNNQFVDKRDLDSSYKSSGVEDGAKSIKLHHDSGTVEIVSHRMVKEGHGFGLALEDWSRSGSAEVGFSVPGMNKDIIFPLEQQLGFCFRSFSDQYVFCNAPARSFYLYGINDEATS